MVGGERSEGERKDGRREGGLRRDRGSGRPSDKEICPATRGAERHVGLSVRLRERKICLKRERGEREGWKRPK